VPFEQGYALVVGVGSYTHIPSADIPISVTDARQVRDVLLDGNLCGYLPERVPFLHDHTADRQGILTALDDLATKTSSGNTVLVYYCGHGAYGTDGNYYLTTYDTKVVDGKIVKGTGISEGVLIDKLRAIPASRLLLFFNACHSGEISPDLGIEEERSFGDLSLPAKAADAMLSAGEGRILITACRPDQKSWIGTRKLSIFTQALVEGLRGEGYVPNQQGYISAFGLYEHLYLAVRQVASELGKMQEPELTVLKGVGPFPVALYRGATDLGTFDARETLPEATAARQVDPEYSRHLFRQVIKIQTELQGSGAIAQGEGAKAVGAGGLLVERDINTQGAAVVFGGVNTGGGDFVARDKVIKEQEVRIDRVGGDKITIGDVGSGAAVAAGKGAYASAGSGLSSVELDALFSQLTTILEDTPAEYKSTALEKVESLKTEVAKGEEADDSQLAKLIDSLIALAPGAVSAVVSVFASPILGGIAGPVTKFVLEKIQGE
jgi:hypothetical protein